MLLVISPSKTQETDVPIHGPCSQPLFIPQTGELAQRLQQLDRQQLGALMKMSDKLAAVNHERFARFSSPFTEENARQALFMFKGDQFASMAVEQYSEKQLLHGQQHLRILSGLYGMLRPLDLMQPYRLEMATRMEVGETPNLYSYWGERVTDALNRELAADLQPILVNLASAEYFKVIRRKELKAKIVTLSFKQEKEGKLKTIAIHAKRARGAMVDFVIQNRISKLDELQSFGADGYRFREDLSTEDEWLFSRSI